MWQPLVKEKLFKDNSFLRYLTNRDEYVLGGRVVHIPQSGGPAGVVKNRQTLPALVYKRNDTDIVYALNEYTSNPTTIPNADTVELSYDKRMSVINENTSELMEFLGDDMLYLLFKDTPALSKIPTTGTAAPSTAPGSNGNRKILLEANIRAAKKLLDKQNVPKNNRFMLLDTEALDQLQSDNNLRYAFQQVVDLREGVVARLFGFDILDRSSVLRVSNTLDVKAPTAANASNDNAAVVFWQQDYLERAIGEVNMYDNYGRAEYYGDIFSFLIRASGRSNREDGKGFGLIYNAPE